MIVTTLAADANLRKSVMLSTALPEAEELPGDHDASDREQRQGLLALSGTISP